MTERLCPACRTRPPEQRVQCELCRGCGLITKDAAHRYAYKSRRHASSTTMYVAKTIQELITELLAEGDPNANGIAVAGERLLLETDEWNVRPKDGPDGVARLEVYERVSDWMHRAQRHLTRKKS